VNRALIGGPLQTIAGIGVLDAASAPASCRNVTIARSAMIPTDDLVCAWESHGESG